MSYLPRRLFSRRYTWRRVPLTASAPAAREGWLEVQLLHRLAQVVRLDEHIGVGPLQFGGRGGGLLSRGKARGPDVEVGVAALLGRGRNVEGHAEYSRVDVGGQPPTVSTARRGGAAIPLADDYSHSR